MKKKLLLPPIYPITDKKLAQRCDHYSILKELVRGGARLVQIRDKDTPSEELLADLKRCLEFASKRNVCLILNDRCDLVLSSGLEGVHLGQDDLPPEKARILLGQKRIIGFSTHSLPQVRKTSSLPIDYIGFGPVFRTMTKKNPSPAVGLKKLENACRQSPVPVVAIGGIGPKQVRDVLDAGASSAAVVSAIMKSEDIAGRMEYFIEAAMGKG
jgi:thiamine-phosphate pyrophosphorylase